MLSGRVEEVEASLKAAERAWADAPAAEEPFEPSIGRAASVFTDVPATIALEHAFLAEFRGDAEGAAVFASRALDQLAEGEWLLASQAKERLAGALTLACPRGYVRVFADKGPPMAVLLGRLVAARKAERAAARDVPLDHLARVLRQLGLIP